MSEKSVQNDSESAKLSDLETLVAEMRKLGVKEYRNKDGLAIVLGDEPDKPLTEEQEEAQQRLRDQREQARLGLKRSLLTAAATRIGPRVENVK